MFRESLRTVAFFLVCGVAACGGGGGGGATAGETAGGGTGAPGAPTFTVSVSVSGLTTGDRIELSLNDREAIAFSASGTQTFNAKLNDGASYQVRIQLLTGAALCEVAGEQGVIAARNTTVEVTCTPAPYSFNLVADVNAASTDNSSFPAHFLPYDGRVAFSASLDSLRGRLYTTNGSAGLATELIASDLVVPVPIAALGKRLIYNRETPQPVTSQLVVFDGRTGSQQILAEVSAGPASVIADRAAFFAQDSGEVYGFELWISDGTPGGTRLVKDIHPGVGSATVYFDLQRLGNRWFFQAYDGALSQLWRSDGTAAGTRAVAMPGLDVRRVLGVHGGWVYFVAGDSGGTGDGVWASDGVPGNEFLVTTLSPDQTGTANCFYSASNGIYFSAMVEEAGQLNRYVWFSDGTPGNPGGGLLEIAGDACGFAELGGQVFFAAEQPSGQIDLWASDGTKAGTRRIATDVAAFNLASQFDLFALSDRILFAREVPESGRELWWTDGVHVELVKDLFPGTGSGLSDRSNLIGRVVDDRLYFAAQDQTTGIEPWVTDGTPEGTLRLGNLRAETRTLDGVERLLGSTSAGIFFSGCKTQGDCELWVTDGTSTGTREVVDLDPDGGTYPVRAASYQDRLYFTNNQGGLWVSDGTAPGTRKVSPVFVRELFPAEGALLMSGSVETSGMELWKTDGTAAGTTLVADIAAGSASSDPSLFTTFKGRVYFRAAELGGRVGLWRTDPSTGSTERVALVGIASSSQFPQLAATPDYLIFGAQDDASGWELWRSDGTGATQIADINAGVRSSGAQGFREFEGEVFFRAVDASGAGLWATDGTSARKVAQVNRDRLDDPGYLTVVNGRMYLSASSHPEGHMLSVLDHAGAELRFIPYQDNGTVHVPRGFQRLDDQWIFFEAQIASGSHPHVSNDRWAIPLSRTVSVVDGKILSVTESPHAGVYFVGYSDSTGQELWRIGEAVR